MNFFEHQHQARSQTKRLLVLMGLAVLGLIAVTALFVALLLHYTSAGALPSTEQASFWSHFWQLLDWQMVSGIALVVIAVVVLGSLYRLSQLRGGGAVVAESLGGRQLNTGECSAKEKRLLNIVEEMAIASGTPVPPVYLLDEAGINAFAAGYRPADAVIGVTRGAIEQLNREQLQGVIAHEFSHILHGDMRLNLRLVGLLHGILLIGLLGELVMRSGRHSRKNGGGVVLFGLGLMIIGYAGTFCGKLIRSAVSRQREFLADASAVQFTRNPGGIGGALKRIGGYPAAGRVDASNAGEYAHFYFAEALNSWLGGLFATHPPLAERIKRIEPRWAGEFLTAPAPDADAENPAVAGFSAQPGPASQAGPEAEAHTAQAPTPGQPSPAELNQASQLLAAMDPALADAAHNSASALALIYGLLFTEAAADTQRALLEREAPRPLIKLYQHYLPAVRKLPAQQRLPLIELALPALKGLSAPQLAQSRRLVLALIKADQQLTLHEWSVYSLLHHNLFSQARPAKSVSLDQVQPQLRFLLAAMARQGSGNQQQAYNLALAALNLGIHRLPEGPANLQQLDQYLDQLSGLKPLQKPRLLKALVTAMDADGELQLAEYELLRVVADRLDCPLPIRTANPKKTGA